MYHSFTSEEEETLPVRLGHGVQCIMRPSFTDVQFGICGLQKCCFCTSPTGLNYLSTSYAIPSHLEEIGIVLRKGCYFLSRTYWKVCDSPLHAPGRPCVSLILSQGFKSEFLRLFLRKDKCGFSPAPAAWSCSS